MQKTNRSLAEIQLPLELLEVLNKGNCTGILSTFSDQGVPYASPLRLMVPRGMSSLFISMDKRHMSYKNLVWQKKVTICFLEKNNMAYSVSFRAGVVKAPSDIHPEMNVVRLDVTSIHSETSPFVSIENGIRARSKSPEMQEIDYLLMEELKDMALDI